MVYYRNKYFKIFLINSKCEIKICHAIYLCDISFQDVTFLKMSLEKESMPSHLPIAARKSGQASTLPGQFWLVLLMST